MKVCKKCKKKVANKAKICRFCGADVSKAKIIPNKNNNEKYKNNKKQIQIQVNDKEIKVQNLQIKNESNKKNKLDFIKAIPKKILLI